MQTLKNVAFGLGHGLILLALLFATCSTGIFVIAKFVGFYLLSLGVPGLWALIAATAVCCGFIALIAWKVLMPYTDWLEPRLRKIM